MSMKNFLKIGTILFRNTHSQISDLKKAHWIQSAMETWRQIRIQHVQKPMIRMHGKSAKTQLEKGIPRKIFKSQLVIGLVVCRLATRFFQLHWYVEQLKPIRVVKNCHTFFRIPHVLRIEPIAWNMLKICIHSIASSFPQGSSPHQKSPPNRPDPFERFERPWTIQVSLLGANSCNKQGTTTTPPDKIIKKEKLAPPRKYTAFFPKVICFF